MTKLVQDLTWLPQNSGDTNYVARILVDFSVDPDWIIQLLGTAQGSDTGANVVPAFALVDNLSNSTSVSVIIGNVTYSVPAFDRENFPITAETTKIEIRTTGGLTNLYLSEAQLAANVIDIAAATAAGNAALLAAMVTLNTSINNLNTQTAASSAALLAATNNVLAATNSLIAITPPLFPNTLITATRAQVAGDNKKSVSFNGGANITYTLLAAATAGAGWNMPVSNAGGSSKNVSITPQAGEFINGVFSNGSPLILNPGDHGVIYCDGTNWIFKGSLSSTSFQVGFSGVGAGSGNANHGLGKVPDSVTVNFTCTTLNTPFPVGAVVDLSRLDKFAAAGSATSVSSATAIVTTNTNTSFSFSSTGVTSDNISNVAGIAAGFNINNADWKFVVQSFATWP